MLWKTKTNGAFPRVRLSGGLAFKTPYTLNCRQLKSDWRRFGRPKSLPWLWKTWCDVSTRTACRIKRKFPHNRPPGGGWGSDAAPRTDEHGTEPGYSRFHSRRPRPLAVLQSIWQVRSAFAAAASPGSVSAAHLRSDFQCHHQTVRQSTRLDGRRRRYDGCLRHGVSVRSLALGFACRTFKGCHDRQLTNAVLSLLNTIWRSEPADGERYRSIVGLPSSPARLLRGLLVAAAAVTNLGDWAWSLPVVLAGVAVALW